MENLIYKVFDKILNIHNIKVISFPEDDIDYAIYAHDQPLKHDLKQYCPTYAIARTYDNKWIGLYEKMDRSTNSSDLIEISETFSDTELECLKKLVYEIKLASVKEDFNEIMLDWDLTNDCTFQENE
jgi:hypothetical protein